MAGPWQPYLAGFHAERAGISETVLRRARRADGDPYDWLRSALPDGGPVVDLACGSGPLAPRVGRRWLGVDRSPEEADLAADRARGRVVVGDASAVPLGSGCADAVVCSLALMLVEPLDAVLVRSGASSDRVAGSWPSCPPPDP